MNYRTPLLIIGLLVLATATLASLHTSVRPRPVAAAAATLSRPLQIEEEEYAVYSAMINSDIKESESERKDADERVLIINDTPSIWQGFVADESKNFFEELKNSSPALQPETVNDLQIKSKETYRLERKLSINIKYLLVKDEEIEALFKDDVMGGWEGFHRKYPKSSGILSFSRVGFNADKTQALVYRGWSCGGLCGGGGYTLLTKKKRGWVVGPRIGPTWVS